MGQQSVAGTGEVTAALQCPTPYPRVRALSSGCGGADSGILASTRMKGATGGKARATHPVDKSYLSLERKPST